MRTLIAAGAFSAVGESTAVRRGTSRAWAVRRARLPGCAAAAAAADTCCSLASMAAKIEDRLPPQSQRVSRRTLRLCAARTYSASARGRFFFFNTERKCCVSVRTSSSTSRLPMSAK